MICRTTDEVTELGVAEMQRRGDFRVGVVGMGEAGDLNLRLDEAIEGIVDERN